MVLAHAFNPSTRVQGQPRLHRQTLYRKKKTPKTIFWLILYYEYSACMYVYNVHTVPMEVRRVSLCICHSSYHITPITHVKLYTEERLTCSSLCLKWFSSYIFPHWERKSLVLYFCSTPPTTAAHTTNTKWTRRVAAIPHWPHFILQSASPLWLVPHQSHQMEHTGTRKNINKPGTVANDVNPST